MTGKKSSDSTPADVERPSGAAPRPGAPKFAGASTHPLHKEAFTALLGLAAKSLGKTG